VYKSIPAGAGDKMQYLVHNFNDNTIRFILKYPCLLDPEALKGAARALILSTGVLHSSFRPGRFSARWQISDSIEDDCFFQYVPSSGDPTAEALSLACLPVTLDGKSQLICRLVQSSCESFVVLTVSHLCVDGGDGKYLLRKLTEAYNLILSSGSCRSLSIKQGSRSVRQLYRSLRPGQFLSLLKDPRTGVKSVCPFPSDQPGRPVILHETIPETVMTAARLRAKDSGATVNDLLIAACYHAYAALPGVDARAPMSVMSMLDLRRHCPGHDSEGLSNLSGSLPTALMKGVSGSYEETLADISAQTLRIKSDPLAGLHGMPLLHIAASTAPLRLVEMAASRLYGSMSVGLTNLGNIDCGQLAMGGVRPAAGWFAGPLKKKPGMQVSAASFGSACALCIAGCYADEDISLLQALLRRIAGIIKDYSQI